MLISSLLILVFLGVLFLGVPIFMALGLSVVACISTGQVFSFLNMVTGVANSGDNFALIAVPFFIMAGEFMSTGGVSKRIVDFSDALVGHWPGGLGMVAVLACAVFAALSGSGVAACAAIGGFTIPAMIQQGYPRGYASSLNAISSALGPIIPPSITMILYGITCNVSVVRLYAGGILPGITLAAFLMIANLLMAKKYHWPTKPKATFKEKMRAFNNAKWSLFIIAVILGGIYGGIFSPTEAAIIATVLAFIVGFFIYKEIKVKDIFPTTVKALKNTGIALALLGFAVMFGRVMVMVGLPTALANWMLSITDQRWVALLLINAVLLVVGCLMETASATIICSPILYGVARQYGVDPVHFGLILVSNLCVGLATPPVGQSLFVASSISGTPFSEMMKPLVPLLIAAFAALMLITFVPELTLFLANLVG